MPTLPLPIDEGILNRLRGSCCNTSEALKDELPSSARRNMLNTLGMKGRPLRQRRLSQGRIARWLRWRRSKQELRQ
jgi:hypothetical protein